MQHTDWYTPSKNVSADQLLSDCIDLACTDILYIYSHHEVPEANLEACLQYFDRLVVQLVHAMLNKGMSVSVSFPAYKSARISYTGIDHAKYAGLDPVKPGALLLSHELLTFCNPFPRIVACEKNPLPPFNGAGAPVFLSIDAGITRDMMLAVCMASHARLGKACPLLQCITCEPVFARTLCRALPPIEELLALDCVGKMWAELRMISKQ
jgi:hypothetical protein